MKFAFMILFAHLLLSMQLIHAADTNEQQKISLAEKLRYKECKLGPNGLVSEVKLPYDEMEINEHEYYSHEDSIKYRTRDPKFSAYVSSNGNIISKDGTLIGKTGPSKINYQQLKNALKIY